MAERAKEALSLGDDWEPWGMFDSKTGHRFERIVVILTYEQLDRARKKGFLNDLSLAWIATL
jgi:hypothetical protein